MQRPEARPQVRTAPQYDRPFLSSRRIPQTAQAPGSVFAESWNTSQAARANPLGTTLINSFLQL
jgi:hypothetical protein